MSAILPLNENGRTAPPLAIPAIAAVELAVIIPTLNERDNIEPLLARLEQALDGTAWEATFVDDDSTDGTRSVIRAIAQRDQRVRCLHRIGRRGLASACIEGALATSAPYIAVIDADLQHDERLLGKMLDMLKSEPIDIVIGSRYIAGGSVGQWGAARTRISGVATRLGRYILKADIADPMSGFFMVSRDAFEQSVRGLSGIGFKILMDIFASSPAPLHFKELPYEFRARTHGESKLDSLAVWEYVMLVGDKLIGHIIPIRFLSFSIVGGLGLLVHLAVLGIVLNVLDRNFEVSQAAATVVAMVSNFTLNNLLTYRDLRLKGWGFVVGFLSFFLVCALGAIANVGVATLLYDYSISWWLAGIAGAVVSAVWNYAVSGVFTWRKKSVS